MADTLFQNGTVIVPAWLNDVNRSVYNTLYGVVGTNTITATGPQGFTSYFTGQVFWFFPQATNSGPVTLNVSGLGPKAVTKNGALALVAGDLVAGTVYELFYDGTQFQLINPGVLPVPAANITGQVAIANGGTGQTTALAALTALGGKVAGNYSSYQTIAGTTTLTVADIGKTFSASVSNPVVNLPVGSTLAVGDSFTFSNSVTLTRQSTDQIIGLAGTLVNTLVTGNFPLKIVWRGAGVYSIAEGASLAGITSSSGFVKLPGGILYQFGTVVTTTDASGLLSFNWPIPFASAPIITMGTSGDSGTGSLISLPYLTGFPTATSGAFQVKVSNTGSPFASAGVRINWIAVGAG